MTAINGLQNAVGCSYHTLSEIFYIGLLTELPVDIQTFTTSKPEARLGFMKSMTPNAMQ